jgi:hypothetical protein
MYLEARLPCRRATADAETYDAAYWAGRAQDTVRVRPQSISVIRVTDHGRGRALSREVNPVSCASTPSRDRLARLSPSLTASPTPSQATLQYWELNPSK